MAKIIGKPNIDLKFQFEINEAEARALDALVGYGDDAFIKHFYETLGKCYMENHEKGLREFFQSIRQSVPGILSQLGKARSAFEGKQSL